MNNFYRGKKVLVTGHTGFKGGWLALWLRDLGADVLGYSLPPPTSPSLFAAAGLQNKIPTIIGDIRDKNAFHEAFSRHRPEIVFHLAAQAIVRQSYQEPAETYETNVLGTVNVLEVCRLVPSARAIVVVTSDKCYENIGKKDGYREEDSMGGSDPYSSSKGCAELVTRAYSRSYFSPQRYREHGVSLVSARAGNVIGGGDWAKDRLIPDCVRAFTAGRPITIRYPNAVRPWQYVLDVIYGYLLLAKRAYEDGERCSGGWNFGPDVSSVNNKPVQWLIKNMINLWGGGASFVVDAGDHPAEAYLLTLNCGKAAEQLRWRPKYDIGRTLKSVVDWHKAFNDEEDMHQYTLGQIYFYQRDL